LAATKTKKKEKRGKKLPHGGDAKRIEGREPRGGSKDFKAWRNGSGSGCFGMHDSSMPNIHILSEKRTGKERGTPSEKKRNLSLSKGVERLSTIPISR